MLGRWQLAAQGSCAAEQRPQRPPSSSCQDRPSRSHLLPVARRLALRRRLGRPAAAAAAAAAPRPAPPPAAAAADKVVAAVARVLVARHAEAAHPELLVLRVVLLILQRPLPAGAGGQAGRQIGSKPARPEEGQATAAARARARATAKGDSCNVVLGGPPCAARCTTQTPGLAGGGSAARALDRARLARARGWGARRTEQNPILAGAATAAVQGGAKHPCHSPIIVAALVLPIHSILSIAHPLGLRRASPQRQASKPLAPCCAPLCSAVHSGAL